MSSTVPDPYVREVAEGIFAYIQPDGTWFLNNAGFLVGSRGVAMVDQCGTEQRARALFDRVREPGGRPVHTLINTHHHADHTFGNFVLPPETTIVGHRRARDEVIATGTGIAAAFQGPDWGEIQISPPFLCFEDRLSLFIDDLEVELIHFGTAAHTTNDIVVWIPERGVLFSGDLIFKGGTPFALQGSVAGWAETLEKLRDLGAETIVPGHGPICGPEAIDEVAAYLAFLQQTAREGFEAGLEPLELASPTDLGPFASLTDPERIVGNLHRAYSELRGEPLGTPLALPPIIGDMQAYIGGPIVSHA
jgi:cyclase